MVRSCGSIVRSMSAYGSVTATCSATVRSVESARRACPQATRLDTRSPSSRTLSSVIRSWICSASSSVGCPPRTSYRSSSGGCVTFPRAGRRGRGVRRRRSSRRSHGRRWRSLAYAVNGVKNTGSSSSARPERAPRAAAGPFACSSSAGAHCRDPHLRLLEAAGVWGVRERPACRVGGAPRSWWWAGGVVLVSLTRELGRRRGRARQATRLRRSCRRVTHGSACECPTWG